MSDLLTITLVTNVDSANSINFQRKNKKEGSRIILKGIL